jgi:chemotaxis protein MotB
MERWLLTYADMITLLLALFIVLWSVSSVNISKFSALKASLHEALSGKVIEGSAAILNGGPAPLDPQGTQIPTIKPAETVNIRQSITSQIVSALAQRDTENLRQVEREIRRYAQTHGLGGVLRTSIDERGLVVRVLTDKLLFGTGSATLRPEARPLIDHLARLLTANGLPNHVRVEGNTDVQPISTAQFHSNWELSAARATAVLTALLSSGVQPARLSVAGYGAERPIASNATAAGRTLNRRVDVVVLRRSSQGAETP